MVFLEEQNNPVEWNSRNGMKFNRAKSLNSWITAVSPSRQACIDLSIYISIYIHFMLSHWHDGALENPSTLTGVSSI